MSKQRLSLPIDYLQIIDSENLIFMEDVKIRLQGKHVELQQNHKLYYQLCKVQLQS